MYTVKETKFLWHSPKWVSRKENVLAKITVLLAAATITHVNNVLMLFDLNGKHYIQSQEIQLGQFTKHSDKFILKTYFSGIVLTRFSLYTPWRVLVSFTAYTCICTISIIQASVD
jgi:hypothetical protein